MEKSAKRRSGRTIWITERLWHWLAEKTRYPLEDTPDSVLRRELGLPPNDDDLENSKPRKRKFR